MKKADIYVTGSNSKMLSSEIITEFRGRGDEIRVYPLTYKEFLESKKSDSNDSLWNEYCLYGGLPQLINIKTDEEKNTYLTNIFRLVYIRDIIDRYNINLNKEVLDVLIDIISSNIGSLTNPLKISNTFKSEYKTSISYSTIKKYLDILVDSFILNEAKRYDLKGKKYINSISKYYFSDIGIRNAKLNFRQIDMQHIIENIIYNELLYRGYNIDIGVIESFSKENNKTIRKTFEIDFIANKGSEKIYIQFANNILSDEKMLQETRGFNKIRDSFKKILLINDSIPKHQNNDGYIIMNVREFLLGEW